jgi:hypothetical protein
MLPEAYVSHYTTNRMRIKIPARKGSESFFQAIAQSISKLPAIDSVEVNPVTASVLMFHHSDAQSLYQMIRQQRIVSLQEAPSKFTTLRQDMTKGLKTVNNQIAGFTGGKVDLWDVAGFSLIGAGIYQLLKGNFMAPAWYTAFWYAFGILSKAQSGDNTINGD